MYSLVLSLAEDNLLNPIVLLVSVLLSYLGIVRTIKSERDNVKDRATISYIMERNKDDNFSEGLYTILSLDRDDNVDIKKYAKKEHRETEEAKKIRYIVNHYEYLSVGVLNNIYNENMLKKASKGTTIKIYLALENYIKETRIARDSDTIYENFECLAKRWDGVD